MTHRKYYTKVFWQKKGENAFGFYESCPKSCKQKRGFTFATHINSLSAAAHGALHSSRIAAKGEIFFFFFCVAKR